MEILLLLFKTILLRPYVFAFLAAFLVSAIALIGWPRTWRFWLISWITAFVCEFSSTRNGIPFEIAIVLAGAVATLIGCAFAITALRVRGLYLALSTLALQFVMDWVISHVPAISGGVGATLQAPAMRLLGQPIKSEVGLYYVALGWALLVTLFMLNLRRTSLGRALVAAA